MVEVAGAAVNVRCKKSSHTPLHEAVIGGHTSIVALLVKNGSNILMKDNTGSLPIHIACASNHVSIVRILINSKAAKKALLTKDGHGKTPRQLCATKFLRTIVEGKLSFNFTVQRSLIFNSCFHILGQIRCEKCIYSRRVRWLKKETEAKNYLKHWQNRC